MIYGESITGNSDFLRIERQRNKIDEDWYGICLCSSYENTTLSDNDEYIFGLIASSDGEIKSFLSEANMESSRKHIKALRKLLKKAVKLGWFDHISVSTKHIGKAE